MSEIFFCQLVLELMEQARGGAAGVQKLDDLIPDRRDVAAQNGGTSGLEQVVVPVAVDIPQLGPLCLGNHNGEGVVESQVVLDPAGDDLFRLGDHRFGLGTLGVKVVFHVVRQLITADGPDGLFNQFVQLAGHLRRVQVLIDGKTVIGHSRFLHSFL